MRHPRCSNSEACPKPFVFPAFDSGSSWGNFVEVVTIWLEQGSALPGVTRSFLSSPHHHLKSESRRVPARQVAARAVKAGPDILGFAQSMEDHRKRENRHNGDDDPCSNPYSSITATQNHSTPPCFDDAAEHERRLTATRFHNRSRGVARYDRTNTGLPRRSSRLVSAPFWLAEQTRCDRQLDINFCDLDACEFKVPAQSPLGVYVLYGVIDSSDRRIARHLLLAFRLRHP